MVSTIFQQHQKAHEGFSMKNVKESVLNLRKFAFDGIFSIEILKGKDTL